MVRDIDLRLAIVGCGQLAREVHGPNVAAMPGASTVAWCDVDETRSQALLEAHGGAYATTDVQRVLDDDGVDAVLFMVDPTVHAGYVQACARAGKHIFCEKPIAVELEDALETVRVVESSGILFQYGTCNRLAYGTNMAKRMCPTPLYSYCQCVDTVTHQAVHNLDLAVHLFHDAPLQRVYASGGQFWDLDPHLPADSFSAILTFADNSTHTYIQHGHAYNALLKKYHYQLFGSDGCVFLAHRFKEVYMSRSLAEVERVWMFQGDDTDRGPYGYMGHYEEVAELVACVRGGGAQQPRLTVRDAAYVLAVEKAILASLERQEVVDFDAFLEAAGAGFLAADRG